MIFQNLIKNYLNLIKESTISKEEFKNYYYNGFYIQFRNIPHIIEKLQDKYRGNNLSNTPNMTPSEYKKNIQLFLDIYFTSPQTEKYRYQDQTSYMVKYSGYKNLCIPIVIYYKDDADLFKGQNKFTVHPGAIKPRNYVNKNYQNQYITLEEKDPFDQEFDWNNYIEIII